MIKYNLRHKKDLAFVRSFLNKEEVGFELTVRSSRTTVFKTAPLNRSGTPPKQSITISYQNYIFLQV